MINEYFVENRHFYVNGFADEFKNEVGDVNAVETDCVNKLFKWYMWFYKNIKVNLRFKFWRDVRDDALSKCGLERKQPKPYKYHYVIYEKDALYGWAIQDTAQDLLMLKLMLNWLCQYHGITYHDKFKVEKKRISKDEWKARYC